MDPAAEAALWLVRSEDDIPPGTAWLAPCENGRAAGLRYRKRHTEYLLRRLVAKHTVALLAGLPTDPAGLAAIEVRNAPTGAPYVVLDGARIATDISLTDRAGWAVCAAGRGLGCDLELVEPRTPGFLRTFLTPAERRFVAAHPPGDARDLAANLIWSAKESTLKVLHAGLRRDVRDVQVEAAPADGGEWAPLAVRVADRALHGWWRREGRFVLTVVTAAPSPPPLALAGPRPLADALPRYSWLDRPLTAAR